MVEKLSKLKKIIMENEKNSNMATPIILPTFLSMKTELKIIIGIENIFDSI